MAGRYEELVERIADYIVSTLKARGEWDDIERRLRDMGKPPELYVKEVVNKIVSRLKATNWGDLDIEYNVPWLEMFSNIADYETPDQFIKAMAELYPHVLSPRLLVKEVDEVLSEAEKTLHDLKEMVEKGAIPKERYRAIWEKYAPLEARRVYSRLRTLERQVEDLKGKIKALTKSLDEARKQKEEYQRKLEEEKSRYEEELKRRLEEIERLKRELERRPRAQPEEMKEKAWRLLVDMLGEQGLPVVGKTRDVVREIFEREWRETLSKFKEWSEVERELRITASVILDEIEERGLPATAAGTQRLAGKVEEEVLKDIAEQEKKKRGRRPRRLGVELPPPIARYYVEIPMYGPETHPGFTEFLSRLGMSIAEWRALDPLTRSELTRDFYRWLAGKEKAFKL